MNLQAQGMCGRLYLFRSTLGIRVVGIYKHGNCLRSWHQLMQQLYPLLAEFRGDLAYPRDVGFWPTQARYNASLDWVIANEENDGNRLSRGLCRQGDDRTTDRGNYRYSTADKVSSESR